MGLIKVVLKSWNNTLRISDELVEEIQTEYDESLKHDETQGGKYEKS